MCSKRDKNKSFAVFLVKNIKKTFSKYDLQIYSEINFQTNDLRGFKGNKILFRKNF